MAAKAGDIVGQYSPENYAKLQEINRLLKANGKPKGKTNPGFRRMTKAHPKLFAIFLISFVLSIGAYGYVSLTILVPHVPAHGLLMNCPSAVPSKSSVVVNSSGFILVTCNGNGVLRALAGTNGTANYTLPSPYLDLYLYPAGQDSVIQNRCTDAAAAVNLVRPVIFGYAGNWSLCADYGLVGANGLPGFDVGWTVS